MTRIKDCFLYGYLGLTTLAGSAAVASKLENLASASWTLALTAAGVAIYKLLDYQSQTIKPTNPPVQRTA